MKNKKNRRFKVFSFWSYLFFFVLISLVVSCSTIIFLKRMRITWNIDTITDSMISTFLNVLIVSALITFANGVRNYYFIERPLKRILEETKSLAKGDFTARINENEDIFCTEEMTILMSDINEMAKELSGIETLRTDFIANVSHELKTPLAVINNYATLLQSGELSEPEQKNCANSITEASRNLSSLVTNILRLNKLENQQIYPDKEIFDLGSQLAECLFAYDDILESKKIEVETEIPDQLIVEGDKEFLYLVWNNLLSNAVKFTPEHGLIKVKLTADGKNAIVSVEDNGCGMSKETGKHIFEKFYQGNPSRTTSGNGLGLSLVKRVIDIMQGNITVSSIVGKGSSFTVRLPVVYDERIKNG